MSPLFVILPKYLYSKIITCKEKYEPRLLKVRIFTVWLRTTKRCVKWGKND